MSFALFYGDASHSSTMECHKKHTQSVEDVLNSEEDFETFAKALRKCGLWSALQTEKPLTLFAPTNDAFKECVRQYGLDSVFRLLSDERLTNILKYHIVPTDLTPEHISDVRYPPGEEMETALNGNVLVLGSEHRDIKIRSNLASSRDIDVTSCFECEHKHFIYRINGVLMPSAFSTDKL
jgi:uncharacterized surface protein with fasciclin (FAS1) repeats